MTDRLIKGVDFCSVHQHHLSCLSEGTQFLASKCSHSSLSFIFSLYFSELITKMFHFSFKYFENQILISGTSWILLFPYKQTCQTPTPGGSCRCWSLGRLPSALLSAGCWVMCKIVTFQDAPEAHKAGALHLGSSAIYNPCQAGTACAVTTQSWLCHGTAAQAGGRSWCWCCWASLFCPCGTLPWLWAQVQPGHFSVHSSSDAVTVDPGWRKRSFELVLDKIDFLVLQGWVIYGFSHDSSCYLSLKRAFLSHNVNQWKKIYF